MNYVNAVNPRRDEPRTDVSPGVSGETSNQFESDASDVTEGKQSVLWFRPIAGELLNDPRRWVSAPGNLPVQTADQQLPFWMQKLMQIGRVGGASVKSGAMLWDKLELNVPHQLTEGVLNLKGLDDETARAAQSALIGTFNSSFDENDLEAAAYALSVFLNTHPLFSHMSDAEEFDAPFGPDTAYELVTLGIPRD